MTVLYWISFVPPIPHLVSMFMIARYLKDDRTSTRSALTLGCFIDLIISFLFFFQALFIGANDFWMDQKAPTSDKTAQGEISFEVGTLIAMLISVVMCLFWYVTYKQAYLHYFDNLPQDKKNEINAKNQNSCLNRRRHRGPGRPLGDPNRPAANIIDQVR